MVNRILSNVPIVTSDCPFADSMNMTRSCFRGAPSFSQMSQRMMTTWQPLSRIPVTGVVPLRITSIVLRGRVGAALRSSWSAPNEKVETVCVLVVGRAGSRLVVVASLKYFRTSGESARSSSTNRKTFSVRTRLITTVASTLDSTGAEYLNWGATPGEDDGVAGSGLEGEGLGRMATSGTGRDGLTSQFLSGWASSG